MRRFTETKRDDSCWWSSLPDHRVLRLAGENAGEDRPLPPRLRAGFGVGLRHRFQTLGVAVARGPKTPASLLDRNITHPLRIGAAASRRRLKVFQPTHHRDPARALRPYVVGLVAPAFGVPARLPRLPGREPLFKYEVYYQGISLNRSEFRYACSVGVGRELQGEPPPRFDSQALLNAFQRDLWMEE